MNLALLEEIFLMPIVTASMERLVCLPYSDKISSRINGLNQLKNSDSKEL